VIPGHLNLTPLLAFTLSAGTIFFNAYAKYEANSGDPKQGVQCVFFPGHSDMQFAHALHGGKFC
jgi:hypothetical protein